MKLTQTVIQKTFRVEYKEKVYYVDYLNSDRQTLVLLNRDDWEICDEDHNDLDIYTFYEDKKRIREVKKNLLLADKLISFCIKNFNTYNPA